MKTQKPHTFFLYDVEAWFRRGQKERRQETDYSVLAIDFLELTP